MIKDQTIDEALIEILRTKKALEALRKARKTPGEPVLEGYGPNKGKPAKKSNGDPLLSYPSEVTFHAAAKRASMDLTRVLAKLRASK